MPKFRILVADALLPDGIELLEKHADVDVKTGLEGSQLREVIGDYDALIVRSKTQVTADVIEAAGRLHVIGRAGIGVDNIDVDAATSKGVAVVNAPTGNVTAAAEHTMALMLAVSRDIPRTSDSVKRGEWDRGAIGVELRNKTLGIVGLGKVGSEVARRAQSFGMSLIAYDPFVSPDYAARLGVELAPLSGLIAESDFITLHVPLNDHTRNMMGAKELAAMKPGVRLVNTARGALIDEDALLECLDNGQIAAAGLDVFAVEPPGASDLVRQPRVVATPHLGASTKEAQREVAIEVAEQVVATLQGELASNTINAPFMPPEVHAVIMPYISVATVVGKILIQLVDGQLVGVDIDYEGEISQHDTDLLKSAVLTGILGEISDERINLVNATLQAAQRQLKVAERKSSQAERARSLLTVAVSTTLSQFALTAAVIRGEPHILRVNEQWLDLVPSAPYLLFIDHRDRPGLIGTVGTVTGDNNINISFMEVGRLAPRGRAMMVLGLDDPIPPAVLSEIRAIPHIDSALTVTL